MKTISRLICIPLGLALASLALPAAESGGVSSSASSAHVVLDHASAGQAPPVSHNARPPFPVLETVAVSTSGELEKIMKEVDRAMREAMDKVGNVEEARRALEEASREVQASLTQALGQREHLTVNHTTLNHGGGGGGVSSSGVMWKSSDHPAPVLLVTTALEAAAREAWQEDLRIMDKLFRDELERLAGKEPPRAMGIRLLFSDRADMPPLYLEDYGVVFSYEARLALATSGKKSAPQEQRTTSSAWENARRQLDTTPTVDENHVKVLVQTYTAQLLGPGPLPEYDSAKVDQLIQQLLRALKEAANIRNLKQQECVVVTVAGTNDEGNPARLTLKARKADIDALAAGQLSEEQFREKVTRRIDG